MRYIAVLERSQEALEADRRRDEAEGKLPYTHTLTHVYISLGDGMKVSRYIVEEYRVRGFDISQIREEDIS